MAIILPDHRLCYVPIPKTACTSLKHFFFQIENGRPFTPFTVNGQPFHIHRLHPSDLFRDRPAAQMQDCDRFLIVRDPIVRFLSAYGNRVVHYRELSAEKAGPALRDLGLTPDPSLADFIREFSGYMAASPSIEHHLRPAVDFAGTDPAYYARIFPLSQIETFADLVRKRTGIDVPLQRLQTGGPKIDSADLTPAQIKTIRNIYAKDFEVFSPWFASDRPD